MSFCSSSLDRETQDLTPPVYGANMLQEGDGLNGRSPSFLALAFNRKESVCCITLDAENHNLNNALLGVLCYIRYVQSGQLSDRNDDAYRRERAIVPRVQCGATGLSNIAFWTRDWKV